MKRIVDMRSVGFGTQFAVWDTATDRFDSVCGSHAWLSASDFVDDCMHQTFFTEDYRDRILGLLPSWVPE